MLELTTTLAGRALALTSSLVVHAGVVVALSGHGVDGPQSARKVPVTIEIAVLAEPAPIELSPNIAAVPTRAAASRAQPHSHTHRYPVAAQHDATPHDPTLVHAPLAAAPPTFAMAVPVTASVAAPAFALALAPGHPHAVAPGGAALSQAEGRGEPVAEAGVDRRARLHKGVVPPYPRSAAEASIEADVPLEIVVDVQGRVASARVLHTVGYGLDQAALRGIRDFVFVPALLHGRATPVRMRWTMQFRLQ